MSNFFLTANCTQKKQVLCSTCTLFSVFGFWSLLSYTGFVAEFFLPTPTAVFSAGIHLFLEQGFFWDVLVSISRILAGSLLVLVITVPLGIFAGSMKSVSAFVEPVIVFCHYIPPSAIIPLSILWFGIGEAEKIFIIFYGSGTYVFLAMTDLVAKVRREYIEIACTLGATTKLIYKNVIIPSILPGLWETMRIMMGFAWMFIIIAEIVAAHSGVGNVLIQSQRFVQTANVIAIVLVIGVIGWVTDHLFRLGYRLLFPWSQKAV